MLQRRPNTLPVCGTPDLRGFVGGRGQYEFAVWAEGRVPHSTLVSKHARQIPSIQRPEASRAIFAGC
jgi:hypothetical protein